MDLFIDTSNFYIIYALLRKNKVVHFLKVPTNKNATKIAIKLLEEFLEKHRIKIKDLQNYYLVTGPGSFTSLKIGLNIIKTISLIYPINKIYSINSFELLHDSKRRYVLIPFGKEKYYIRDYKVFLGQFKTKIIHTNEFDILNDSVLGYDSFDSQRLEHKLMKNKFKLSALANVKLLYIDNFKGKINYEN